VIQLVSYSLIRSVSWLVS